MWFIFNLCKYFTRCDCIVYIVYHFITEFNVCGKGLNVFHESLKVGKQPSLQHY